MTPGDRVCCQVIGVVRSPFVDKRDAPRQASVARDAEGRIEIAPTAELGHALEELSAWSHLWVLSWFHLAHDFRPKVQPPRGDGGRVGVLSTRSPHRPNPIGLSAVELVRVEGFTVHVRGLDLLDGTPVLDLKPYVAYADCIPSASAGWLSADPKPAWRVEYAPLAREQLGFLGARGVALRPALDAALALGPDPKPYRRIKRDRGRLRISVKDWRAWFEVGDGVLSVVSLGSGYRASERDAPGLEAHRAFAAEYGDP
ncbi:MAG: tRNA (N6-threonylcarbamoyladenosine(37)-N6)-methyltransferase TrmO [Polyangiaceae bacterium]|nr:tRNA (N6-threonylcarbamoyladenosine(37)-N6)-methyltransferase TrmO [Polyangiaceae bacterium]